MGHAQKPDFVFRRNGRVHLNRRGRQFFRLLAAEVCASAAVILDTPCSEVVWRVLVIHSIRQLLLHFPSRATSCAITFLLELTYKTRGLLILDWDIHFCCMNGQINKRATNDSDVFRSSSIFQNVWHVLPYKKTSSSISIKYRRK